MPQPSDRQRAPLVAPASEDPDDLSHVEHVVPVRTLLEVSTQARDRLGEATHATKEEASVPTVLRVGRLDDGEEVHDAERRRPVAPLQMRRAEVAQHTGED